jgi:D-alanine-D-alanine ligase-like ATP-grasp enzyme
MPPSPLRRVVIAYEPEAACRARLAAAGFDPGIAAEIACYLAQATDLAAIRPEIAGALGEAGLDAVFIELDGLVDALPDLMARRHDTILWCQTDGIAYYRGSAAPAVARLAGIRSYGSPPQAQHLCQDKFKSTALAAAAGLPVPPTALAEGDRVVAGGAVLDGPGPFFVKPNTLGAKIGIFGDSRAADAAGALRLAARLHDRYRDRAVIQPFIPGHDLRVSFMDVGRTLAPSLGIARLLKDPDSETGGAFMTMRDNASLSGSRDTEGTATGFGAGQDRAFVPKLSDLRAEARSDPAAAATVAAIEAMVPRLAELFGLRDYFSVDIRVAEDGALQILEFETCPAVTIYDFQSYLHDAHGLPLGPALARSLTLAHGRPPDV